MNNDLLQELVAAKFPFRLFPKEVKNVAYFPFLVIEGEEYEVPNLSEIIAACGDGFGSLHHFKEWMASGGEDRTIPRETESYEFNEKGATPSEAVARLWLALNKKP